jgi:flagellar biosynthesis/type III secretory pathway M-ring protein FliF/YscJ
MDVLKQQLARLQQQLGGLNASQRMLAVSLVVIMVMTLLYWGRYAGDAEMVPLLDQPFAQEDVARISMDLQSRGIAAQVVGDKIMVPSGRRLELVAQLGFNKLLPRDTAQGFDKWVKQINPFEANGTAEAKLNEGKAQTLSEIIRKFPGVNDARVIIDPTVERRIGGGDIRPSAIVHVNMRGGKRPNQHFVDAVAAVVSGAQSAITKGKIQIVIDDRSYRPTGDEGEGGGGGGIASSEMLERVQAHEEYVTRKIERMVPHDTKVAVTVEVENKTSRANVRTYDNEHTLVKPIEEEERTEESVNTQPAAGEPGVLPNAGMAIGGPAGGGGSTNTVSESKTRNQVLPSVKDEQIHTPAGKPTVTGAAVRVPLSHFVNEWRRRNPAGKADPDEALLQPLIDAELPKIRAAVRTCAPSLTDDSKVSVETYADTMPSMLVGEGPTALASAAGAAGVTAWVGSYGKEAGLAALAVVSLFMVSGMVRKGSTPAPVMPSPVPDMPPPHLTAGEMIAGEVGGGDQTLDGMELDEDAVRAQQMLDQVQTMVKENPDAAANLVKRWLNRS